MKTIPLTQDKVAIVDDEDYTKLAIHNWCFSKGYALRNGPRINGHRTEPILMHREILSVPPGFEVDHKSRNTLDNRRKNLRPATKVQQQGNRAKRRSGGTSKFKGVWFDKARNKFTSMIQVNGKRRCLGRFEKEEDAARAYDRMAETLFGEFAKLNFPN